MALPNLPKIVISNICGLFSKKLRTKSVFEKLEIEIKNFFSLGRFVPWDVLSLGHFVLGTFCPWDLMSEDVLSWDVLSVHHSPDKMCGKCFVRKSRKF